MVHNVYPKGVDNDPMTHAMYSLGDYLGAVVSSISELFSLNVLFQVFDFGTSVSGALYTC